MRGRGVNAAKRSSRVTGSKQRCVVPSRHGVLRVTREKREALDAWARRLHAIVTGEAAAKVVPLRSA